MQGEQIWIQDVSVEIVRGKDILQSVRDQNRRGEDPIATEIQNQNALWHKRIFEGLESLLNF